MKSTLATLAGAVAFTSIILLTMKAPPIEDLRPARFLTCPTGGECDGGYVQKGNKCICLTTTTGSLTGEITDPDDLPASQKYRLVGCCTDYEKWTQWRLITDPVGPCIIILSHKLFSGQSMKNIDLGHAELLNDYCCDTGEPISSGNWGQCPYCSWTCGGAGNNVVPDKDGCDTYCGE